MWSLVLLEMGRICPAEAQKTHTSSRVAFEDAAKLRRRSTVEEMRAIWDKFEARPAFFNQVDMAEDGGFTELQSLYNYHRFLWAFVSTGCLIMNLSFILVPNVSILITVPVSEWMAPVTGAQRWFLVNTFVRNLLRLLRTSPGGETECLNPDVLLALLELGMLAYYLAHAVGAMYRMSFHSGCALWHGVADLFWDIIPELSVFSAMKSLNFVSPQVLVPDLTQKVQRALASDSNHRLAETCRLLVFVCGRFLHFFVGFEAFMIKFVHASQEVSTANSELAALFVSVAFLNQMLGVINVHKFSRRRLFVFIFGGEDSFLSEHEERVAATWLGMLAEKMWEAAEHRVPRLAWFLAVALSYGDSDFQKLVLNEEAKRKKNMKNNSVMPV